jgi:hypothetical protein
MGVFAMLVYQIAVSARYGLRFEFFVLGPQRFGFNLQRHSPFQKKKERQTKAAPRAPTKGH